MKIKITSYFLLSMILMAAGAMQTVPQKVKSTFEKKYSKQKDVQWEEDEDGNFMAFFTINNQEKTACFEPNGTWIYTTTDIDVEALPDCINNHIIEEYNEEVELFSAAIYEMPKVKKQFKVTIALQTINIDFNEDWEEDGEEEIVEEPNYWLITFDDCKFIKQEEQTDLR